MTLTHENAQPATTAEITDILVAHCGLDATAAARSPAATLEELGMDSLALLELQAVLAERYQVQIPEHSGELTIAGVAELVSAPPDPPGHTENSIVIAAPRPVVWELTNDVTRWTELFTEYQAVDVLERQGDTVRFRLTMFPDENGTVWSWVSERSVDRATWQVRAHRVEPGPFEYMRIHWRYTEEPQGTRMTWTQDFAMRPSAPVDNAGMTARINANSRIQLEIIRERVERIARERADAPGSASAAGGVVASGADDE